jgi:alpha-glucosidase
MLAAMDVAFHFHGHHQALHLDLATVVPIFRKALELRKGLVTEEEMQWHETGDANVLHFSRPNGWHCITNFGRGHFDLTGKGEIIHSSGPLAEAGIYLIHGVETSGNDLPPATTVWLKS